MRLEDHFKFRPYKKRKILLVDDEAELGWILKKVIKDAGHSLTCVTTAVEGIRKIKQLRGLDIAIVDLRLENESGLLFVKKAKALNKTAKFIMISAFGDSDTRTKARRLGVSHFLDKPIKIERLLDIINKDC